jgi:Predicted membrane protein
MDAQREKTRKVALLGMMYALAVLLSIVEGWVMPFFGLPPGVKLGLSNIVVMYTLFFVGPKEAYLLSSLKALGVFVTRGGIAAALSLGGGLASVTIMLILIKLPKKWNISYYLIAVAGAVMHNVGQLTLMSLMLSSVYSFYYMPALLVSGIVMGSITGTTLKYIMPALKNVMYKK